MPTTHWLILSMTLSLSSFKPKGEVFTWQTPVPTYAMVQNEKTGTLRIVIVQKPFRSFPKALAAKMRSQQAKTAVHKALAKHFQRQANPIVGLQMESLEHSKDIIVSIWTLPSLPLLKRDNESEVIQ